MLKSIPTIFSIVKMKIFFLLLLSTIVSCTEQIEESPNMQRSSRAISSGKYYYYYQGKRIEIPVVENKVFAIHKKEGNATKSSIPDNSIRLSKSEYGSIVDIEKTGYTQSSPEGDEFTYEYVVGDSVNMRGISNKFFIQLREEADSVLLKEMAEEIHCEFVGKTLKGQLWYTLRCNSHSTMNSLDASNYFYESGNFADVDPGFLFEFKPSSTVLSDSYHSDQWYLNGSYGIDAYDAWEYSKGDRSVVVAVFDSGFTENQADVENRMVAESYDINTQGPAVRDTYNRHGAICAAIVGAAHNSEKYAGIAPEVSMMNIQYYPEGSGEMMAAGFQYAMENGADIINCSWGDAGGFYYALFHSSILEQNIYRAATMGRNGKGCIICFASGNNHIIDYPGRECPETIIVGGTQVNGRIADFSGCGINLDLVAPATDFPSLDDPSEKIRGTSFAAPLVSGTAALMLSVDSTLTSTQVEEIIKNTTYRPYYVISDQNTYGQGLLQAGAALKATCMDYEIQGTPYFFNNHEFYPAHSRFYISGLPANAIVTWHTQSNAASLSSNTGTSVTIDYNLTSNSIHDIIYATISYAGKSRTLQLPVLVENNPIIRNVKAYYNGSSPNNYILEADCLNPNASITWVASSANVQFTSFPYPSDSRYQAHPNLYKAFYKSPNSSSSISVNLYISDGNGESIYNFSTNLYNLPTFLPR